MSYRDFKGSIYQQPEKMPGRDRLLLAAFFIVLAGSFFLMIYGPTDWLHITGFILFITCWIVPLIAPDTKVLPTGSFALTTEGQVLLCETLDPADTQIFSIADTHLRIIIYGSRYPIASTTAQCQLKANGKFHKFHFTIDSYQQQVNITGLINQWGKQKYDVYWYNL